MPLPQRHIINTPTPPNVSEVSCSFLIFPSFLSSYINPKYVSSLVPLLTPKTLPDQIFNYSAMRTLGVLSGPSLPSLLCLPPLLFLHADDTLLWSVLIWWLSSVYGGFVESQSHSFLCPSQFAFLPPLMHPLPGNLGSMVAGLSPSGVVEHSGKEDAAIQRSYWISACQLILETCISLLLIRVPPPHY